MRVAIFYLPDRRQRRQLESLGCRLKPREGGEWLVLRGWWRNWKVEYDDAGIMDSYELWRRGERVGRVFTMGGISSFVI